MAEKETTEMSIDNIIDFLRSDYTLNAAINGWTVPAGMIVLYFYGRYHFNTPAYSLDLSFSSTLSGGDRVRLITQAPPMFTTRRARYNSYAIRYIALLEIAFLGFIFMYAIIEDIASIGKLQIPDLTKEPLHYRSVFALFVLTGFLSSFPGVKQIDISLLAALHKAAFIPDEARDLAAKLYNSAFKPSQDVLATVRQALLARDTARVADGGVSEHSKREL